MTELRSSPGLYLFIPLMVLVATAPILVPTGPFDTPILLTPGTFAAQALPSLTVMLCVLLMFYTVESLWRDRRTGLASISVLEFDRPALVLNRLMVLGLAVLLTAVTARFYTRRDFDPSRLAERLRPRLIRRCQ